MSIPVPISYQSLESAFEWVSAGGPYENEAIVSRTTGEVYYKSADCGLDNELPEDIDDESLYVAVPHKNDVDLGQALVTDFMRSKAPGHVHEVERYFHSRGAYAKFKGFLQREGLLEQWYEYEAMATMAVLEQWALANGFVVVRDAEDA